MIFEIFFGILGFPLIFRTFLYTFLSFASTFLLPSNISFATPNSVTLSQIFRAHNPISNFSHIRGFAKAEALNDIQKITKMKTFFVQFLGQIKSSGVFAKRPFFVVFLKMWFLAHILLGCLSHRPVDQQAFGCINKICVVRKYLC